jgi:hypothetical protein
MVSAAIILAVAVQDRHPKAVDVAGETAQGRSEFLFNASSAAFFKNGASDNQKSTAEATPGQASSVETFDGNSRQEHPSSRPAAAATIPSPAFAFAPEINQTNGPANPGSWSPVQRQDSVGVKQLKIRNSGRRTSVARRYVDVKTRLIALWHQSLARSERARTWTAYSNLKRGVKKKAAYTAETNH